MISNGGRTARVLDDHLDKCFVYSVLLNKSHIYYGRLRTVFKIPLIITSSVMSILNGNIENGTSLKIVNIIFNLLTAILLGLSATLKFDEKFQNFVSCEKKFLKLSSKIEQKLLNTDEVVLTEFVKSIINEYDLIVESLDYDIPASICKKVRVEYVGKKTLPLIINGELKREEYRTPVLNYVKTASMDERVINIDKNHQMMPIIPSIIFEKKMNSLQGPVLTSPRVIEIKPVASPMDGAGLVISGLQE